MSLLHSDAQPQPVRGSVFRGEDLPARFLEFIDEESFPCVGSKIALSRGAIETCQFGRLGDAANDVPVLDALSAFVRKIDDQDPDDSTVHSFAALFDAPVDTDEIVFEHLLWSQLHRLHKVDVERGNPPAADVSSDPQNKKFSLSLAGHPFFVIGLHPGASRTARRFGSPVLVFNSHRQFEQLRADGRYQKMQKATRQRDIELQGSINPNLGDFGGSTEARQYSGRKVEPDWQCPFEFARGR
jgi:hypothetical protein